MVMPFAPIKWFTSLPFGISTTKEELDELEFDAFVAEGPSVEAPPSSPLALSLGFPPEPEVPVELNI